MSETKQEWLQRVADIHGLDAEDIEKIAELCINDTQENINVLKTVERGQDLSDAIRAAHSIKGSSANIHQNEVCNAAKNIENQLRVENFTNLQENISTLESAFINFKGFLNS